MKRRNSSPRSICLLASLAGALSCGPVAAEEAMLLYEGILTKFPELNMAKRGSAYQLNLPNLRIRDCDLFVSGLGVDMTVEFENDGPVSTRWLFSATGEFDTIASVVVTDAITMQSTTPAVPQQTFQVRNIPAIGAMQNRHAVMGTISLDGNSNPPPRDYLVTITVVADPPTQTAPGGEIWESNEMDNSSMRCTCKVYRSKNPVVDMRACGT